MHERLPRVNPSDQLSAALRVSDLKESRILVNREPPVFSRVPKAESVCRVNNIVNKSSDFDLRLIETAEVGALGIRKRHKKKSVLKKNTEQNDRTMLVTVAQKIEPLSNSSHDVLLGLIGRFGSFPSDLYKFLISVSNERQCAKILL